LSGANAKRGCPLKEKRGGTYLPEIKENKRENKRK
jgi:hypothetical protein